MRYIINYFWAILWALIMLVLMIMPSNEVGIPLFEGFDKLAHCGTFFVLAVLLYRGSIIKSKRRAYKWITIFKVLISTVIFAFITEGAQLYFSPTRTSDWWDIFADVVGIGMGTFAYILCYQKREL